MSARAGWWRRNAVALGTLAVLVAAGVWAFDTVEFGAARNAQRSVAPGEAAEIGDWTFAPPTLSRVEPDEVGAPADSNPVVVRVRVNPGSDDVSCTVPTVIDPATGREWRTSYALSWTQDDDESSFCSSEAAAPFDLTTLVLLPGDAPRDLVVEVTGGLGSDAVLTDIRFDAVL